MHTKTLNRLQEQLLEYDFAIHYRKGIENSAADALSRNAVSATEQFLYTLLDESGNLASAQKLDPFIMDVRDLLVKNVQPGGSPGYKAKVRRVTANCFMEKGVIWYNLTKLGGQVVPVLLCPESIRFMVMDADHCSPFSGHSGRQLTGFSWVIGGQEFPTTLTISSTSVTGVKNWLVKSQSPCRYILCLRWVSQMPGFIWTYLVPCELDLQMAESTFW